MTQEILTPQLHEILALLKDSKTEGYRIIVVCPLWREGFFSPDAYIVIREK